MFESLHALLQGDHPQISWLGIILSASSLLVMPYLGIAKQKLAKELNSAAAHGDGKQNILCSYLAAATLLGLLGNAVLGWWWLDAVAGILISLIAFREGIEAWRGEGCSCAALPDHVHQAP